MSEGTTPEGGGRRLRIGNVERNAAMKALDAHLEAGRLGVEEYGDRSAKAAGATTADELEELFTDLPEPHPPLPGSTPEPMAASLSAAPAVRDEAAVAERPSGFLDTAAPRIMAVMPFVALALFFTVGGWWWFLLIPAAGALLYGGGRHGHGDWHGNRSDRRRD